MHIVLPGALPDAGVARELAARLPQTAPTLLRWFERSKAQALVSPAADTLCTPLEHWLLLARGFQGTPGQHLSAGLGPLRAPAFRDDEPCWLAQLIHMAPSRDGAALLPASSLDITETDARALHDSAQEAFAEAGIVVDYGDAQHWTVHWAALGALPCASPELVALSSVNDWWPQDIGMRPWRRLVNHLQMLWHEHPANLARMQAGKPPINSLWLYGGAQPSQLTQALPPDTCVHPALAAPAVRQDWGAWLEALAQLETRVLQPQREAAPTLVLTGRERLVLLEPGGRWLARWRRADWLAWWAGA